MDQVLQQLEDAAKGLLFLSETDAPFEPVDLGVQDRENFQPSQLLTLLDKPADKSLEVQDFSYFFRNMTTLRDGASEEKQAEVRRFQALKELLSKVLTDGQAYRLGQVQVEIYLLGWTDDNKLIGLKTFAVET